jgi:L-lactate utilization protein LutB
MGSVKGSGRSGHVMNALVCGLDAHKDSTYATVLDSSGKIVSQMRMNNERMLSYLSRFEVGKVAMESSNQKRFLFKLILRESTMVPRKVGQFIVFELPWRVVTLRLCHSS